MSQINTGDTAFVLISAALVCLMTPGLAFFYGGLVRKKNVLTIMMQSFISMGVVTTIWMLGGFSLAFGPDIHGMIGTLKYFALQGVGITPNPAYGPTIPFLTFFSYQQMFAVITPALITGAFADRINFKSYLKFYSEVLKDKEFLSSLSYTLYISLASSILSVGISKNNSKSFYNHC